MDNDLLKYENKPGGYYSVREEMLGFVPSGVSRVLDVGCGEGHFGQLLKTKRGVEVWGVEISQAAAQLAKTRLDSVLVGDIAAVIKELDDNLFDCIIFNDVLEHFSNPWEVLTNINSKLKDSGYIVASIPNVRYFENIKSLLLKKKWKYVDAGILDITHLRFFTAKSIEEMFEMSGYRVVSIDGINGPRFPWKFGLLNVLMLNSLKDMRYLQFACVAQKKGK